MLRILIFIFIFTFSFGGIASVQDKGSSLKVTRNNGKIIWVPKQSGNRHYQAVQDWVSQGNSINPDDPWASTVPGAKIKRKKELKREAMDIFRDIALDPSYSSTQVNNYKDALRSSFSAAKTDIDGLSTIADIKNYSVSWPTP